MKSDKKFKRKCVACNLFKDKEDLIKITKTKGGEIILNPNSHQFGRSVYICKSKDCIELAIKNKRLNKALKCQIPSEIIDTLLTQY